VTVLEVEVDVCFALEDYSHSMVVDGEGRLLSHQQAEHRRVAVDNGEFVVEVDVVANLRKMRREDVEHSRQVHQLWLLRHDIGVKSDAKIIILAKKSDIFA